MSTSTLIFNAVCYYFNSHDRNCFIEVVTYRCNG